MIVLKNISRIYSKKNQTSTAVKALDDISLTFPDSGFISICGASGSGKTTLLNIIGGLDFATSGKLIVDGIDTSDFKDIDWDAYRNEKIGFVLQNCYLLPHLSIADNVAIKLQISNRHFENIDEMVDSALKEVDLGDRKKDRPKTFSGGQKQRVAIARAIVGKPTVVLADEPTGALDSKTGKQIMELLKKLSKDHLVVMVTHNKEYAQEFSDRIIELKDGKVVGDTETANDIEPIEHKTSFFLLRGGDKKSLVVNEANKPFVNYQDNPLTTKEDQKKLRDYIAKNKELANRSKAKKELASVSFPFGTSLKWGIRNLILKIASTVSIILATALGLAGVGLILSISKGVEQTFVQTEAKALSQYPIEINSYSSYSYDGTAPTYTPFTDEQVVFADLGQYATRDHRNFMSERFLTYMDNMPKSYYTNKYETSSLLFKTLTKIQKEADDFDPSNNYTVVYPVSNYFYKGLDIETFTKQEYDCIGGEYPKEDTDLAIVVDKYNRLTTSTLSFLGFSVNTSEQHEVRIDFSKIVGKEYRYISNNQIFTYNSETGLFDTKSISYATYEEIYNNSPIKLKISGVLREKRDSNNPALPSGVLFTEAMAKLAVKEARESEIWKAQETAGYSKNVRTGNPITESKGGNITYTKEYNFEQIKYDLGAIEEKSKLQFFTRSFEDRSNIERYFKSYTVDDSVDYTTLSFYDYLQKVSFEFDGALSLMTSVLYAFAFISVFVSAVLNAILTYISVHQRTNEIGLLRSLGARKKDVGLMIETESILSGFLGSLLSILFCVILIKPINLMLTKAIYDYKFYLLSKTTFTLPGFQWWVAPIMIAIGVAVAAISALIPAIIAAKKDPAHAINE